MIDARRKRVFNKKFVNIFVFDSAVRLLNMIKTLIISFLIIFQSSAELLIPVSILFIKKIWIWNQSEPENSRGFT